MKYQITSSIIFVLSSLIISGCSFYQVSTSRTITNKIRSEIESNKKYIIINHGDEELHAMNVLIQHDTILGQVEKLSFRRSLIFIRGTNNINRYRKNDDYIFEELYIIPFKKVQLQEENKFYLPISAIREVQSFEKDKEMTYFSWGLSILGIIAIFFIF